MVTICTYLEAFLQEIAHEYANLISKKANDAKIPKNFILWKMVSNRKNEDLDFNHLEIVVNKKEIADEISGNPGKTISLFKYLGINLLEVSNFCTSKDLVGSVVEKRNNIIHHNDDATDITFKDLQDQIVTILNYMEAINDKISSLTSAEINKIVENV